MSSRHCRILVLFPLPMRMCFGRRLHRRCRRVAVGFVVVPSIAHPTPTTASFLFARCAVGSWRLCWETERFTSIPQDLRLAFTYIA
eukprot:5241138-Pyramimonas_sp.AAC.1